MFDAVELVAVGAFDAVELDSVELEAVELVVPGFVPAPLTRALAGFVLVVLLVVLVELLVSVLVVSAGFSAGVSTGVVSAGFSPSSSECAKPNFLASASVISTAEPFTLSLL